MSTSHRCVVCEAPSGPSAFFVAGEPIGLCASHARRMKKTAPRTFASLAELFEASGLERRVEEDRRRNDRRMFPRPELRRRNHGRRSSDPRA